MTENGIEFVWQLCPVCETKAEPRSGKLVCPKCHSIVLTCCD